jgi:glycine dehydrogenase subunit 2
MKLIFEKSKSGQKGIKLPNLDVPITDFYPIPEKFMRKSELHLPEVAENEVVRHYIKLSTKNYHIDKGFYPLGSCTMKYNPKINEITASLPGFTNIHPFQPTRTTQGALALMYNLGEMLKEITGLKGITLQPSAGAHGEYTAIMMFKKFHDTKGNSHKNIILIPDSAHGTNPASVAISGLIPVNVKSDEKGMVDIKDFEEKLTDNVAGMMITNPNTVGIFEKNIKYIADKLHEKDALLYMDGANLNALLGIVRPGDIGFDAVHINLHKTFSTPHGGGGPGSGPVAVSEKLVPHLPLPQVKINDEGFYYLEWVNSKSIGKVHSFFGNFAILVRAYTYILMQGKEGMKEISKNAIINANYLLSKLKDHFDLPYKETPMHEFVLSGTKFKEQNVKVLDIAKRLLDYGFHAPTIYFPLIVPDALMIEPTESEPKQRLDEFAEAMIKIKEEIYTNPDLLRNAPQNTPLKRLDDAKAAREIDVNYFKIK